MFVIFIHVYRKYHISMYFLRKIIFHFRSKEKLLYFPGKNTIFPDNTRNIIFQCNFLLLERPYFRGIYRKYYISTYFFWERSSFIFRLKNKIIFSGKRNIIFPDNTRKIKFQCNFFWKTIFSEYLEKENVVFRAVGDVILWKTEIYCFLLTFWYFFTRPTLIDELYKDGIYVIGTVR